jgi:hypothetical protein
MLITENLGTECNVFTFAHYIYASFYTKKSDMPSPQHKSSHTCTEIRTNCRIWVSSGAMIYIPGLIKTSSDTQTQANFFFNIPLLFAICINTFSKLV